PNALWLRVAAPSLASSATATASALVSLGQAGLLTAPARGWHSGRSSLVPRPLSRLATRGRPWVRAARLSPWGGLSACARPAFVGGDAHNWSSERTSKGRCPLAAAQLQR